jgi:hypothetical protein
MRVPVDKREGPVKKKLSLAMPEHHESGIRVGYASTKTKGDDTTVPSP